MLKLFSGKLPSGCETERELTPQLEVPPVSILKPTSYSAPKPKIHKIIPVEIRMENYIKKRKEIFNIKDEVGCSNSEPKIFKADNNDNTLKMNSLNRIPSNNITFVRRQFELDSSQRKGVRQRFQLRNTITKRIASTTLESVSDSRKFLLVKINGFAIDGLLDSGASIHSLT